MVEEKVVEEMEKEEEILSLDIMEDIDRSQDNWEDDRIRIRRIDMKEDLLKSKKQEEEIKG